MSNRIKSKLGRSGNKQQRIFIFTALVINIMYGIGNAVVGFMTYSWWFLTVSAYYVILSIMRFALIMSGRRNRAEHKKNEDFIKRFSGAMLLCLSFILTGTVILTVKNDIGTKYHEIIMITIALYTFTKLTVAIGNFCVSKNNLPPIIKALRNLSVADAAVSIFSLHRSMLTSFGGLKIEEIRLFNFLTGTAVCFVVLVLGINLLRKEKRNGKVKISEG